MVSFSMRLVQCDAAVPCRTAKLFSVAGRGTSGGVSGHSWRLGCRAAACAFNPLHARCFTWPATARKTSYSSDRKLQLPALRAVRSCTSYIRRLFAFRPFAESKMRSHKSQGYVSAFVSGALLRWCAVAARNEVTRRVASCNIGSFMAACASAFTVCCSSLFCRASHRFIRRLHGGLSPHLFQSSALVSV